MIAGIDPIIFGGLVVSYIGVAWVSAIILYQIYKRDESKTDCLLAGLIWPLTLLGMSVFALAFLICEFAKNISNWIIPD